MLAATLPRRAAWGLAAALAAVVWATHLPASGSPGMRTPGAQIWSQLYQRPGTDLATAVAASPDGLTVVVTGVSDDDIATLAYDSSNGLQLWEQRFDGGRDDAGIAIATSPDSTEVYVAGVTDGGESHDDFVIIAYDMADGQEPWSSVYRGPRPGFRYRDIPAALEVDPQGDAVYLAGRSETRRGYDYATVSFATAGGGRQWVHRYDGRTGGDDIPVGMAVSSAGTYLFITGKTWGGDDRRFDVYTEKLLAVDGIDLDAAQMRSTTPRNDIPVAIEAAQDDDVVVAARMRLGSEFEDSTVRRYDIDLDQEWTESFDGVIPRSLATAGADAAVGATFLDGGREIGAVLVNGTPVGIWAESYSNSTGAENEAADVHIVGTTVIVSGKLRDPVDDDVELAAVGFDRGYGAFLWVMTYDGLIGGDDAGFASAVAPAVNRLFVVGTAEGIGTGRDYAVIGVDLT